ncbi:OprD family porin [Endozoicomonas sp. Mp262]|uniref:OprD family porin n=1 Tax=Endozoicomonas sp. Mp262 TaxID=2919499 RepID=UPI0021D96639
MKLARLNALSAAVMLASTAYANDFIDDASLDIHLRNYYKHDLKDDKGVNDNKSQIAWTQAVRINLSSGYYANLVGVDLGVHHALKLRGTDGRGDTGLLLETTNSDGKEYVGYGKTSYAIKFNLMDMGVAKYGRMYMDTPLLSDSDSRSLPSLTEGFYAEGAFGAASVYGIIALKENPKGQSGFDNYGYVKGNDKDKQSVQIIGGGYDFGHGFYANLAYGQQKEIAKKYFADLNYSTELEGVGVDVGIQYGKNSISGKSKDDIDKNVAKSDTNQYAWGAKAIATYGAASIGVTYTDVEKTDIGSYQFEWGMTEMSDGDQVMDSSGYFGYNALQYSDFNKSGQKAWGINASYDFDALVEGLSVYGAYVSGKVNEKGNVGSDDPDSWTEKEYNLGVSYAVPMVEGLSAHVQYAHNTQEDKGTPKNNQKKDVVTTDTRVIIKYDLAVF